MSRLELYRLLYQKKEFLNSYEYFFLCVMLILAQYSCNVWIVSFPLGYRLLIIINWSEKEAYLLNYSRSFLFLKCYIYA